jgi:hypothetical protein
MYKYYPCLLLNLRDKTFEKDVLVAYKRIKDILNTKAVLEQN